MMDIWKTNLSKSPLSIKKVIISRLGVNKQIDIEIETR